MADKRLHSIFGLILAFFVLLMTWEIKFAAVAFIGALLPDLDSRCGASTHRSWILHTLLVPAIIWQFNVSNARSDLWVFFLALGMLVHLILDFRKMEFRGTAAPIRPIIAGKKETGWLLLFLALLFQFGFIQDQFLPFLYQLLSL